MLHPVIWPFISRVLGFLYPVVESSQVLSPRFALPCKNSKLQAVTLMLHKMAFQLSGKVVTLHLDNSIAKAYLCNQDGRAFPFFSRLACHILNQADRQGITVIPAYMSLYLNVEADYLSWGRLVPEWHHVPNIIEAALLLWINWR